MHMSWRSGKGYLAAIARPPKLNLLHIGSYLKLMCLHGVDLYMGCLRGEGERLFIYIIIFWGYEAVANSS